MKVTIGKPVEPVEVNVKTVCVHVKVSDEGFYQYLDDTGEVVKEHEGYLPSFFPGDYHWGDYLILDIDLDTGKIINWDPERVRSGFARALGVEE